jgi:hypothetical protein
MTDDKPVTFEKSYTNHAGRQFRRYTRPARPSDECLADRTADVCTRVDRKANPHLTNEEAKQEAIRRLYPD